MEHEAYIGIGSNLDNPLSQVKSAIQALQVDDGIVINSVSGIYQSKPLKIEGTFADVKQDDYINAVAHISTDYTADALLGVLQELEKEHKRVKEYHWGPRTLDLDILLYDELILETDTLTIPHKELANRDFVLYPLKDINPDLIMPKHGKLQDILLNFSKDNLVFVEHYD